MKRILSSSENGIKAHIAQSVEHFLGKEEVTGSNPVMSSTFEFYDYFFKRMYCKLNEK